jgi:hypothetical protein
MSLPVALNLFCSLSKRDRFIARCFGRIASADGFQFFRLFQQFPVLGQIQNDGGLLPLVVNDKASFGNGHFHGPFIRYFTLISF